METERRLRSWSLRYVAPTAMLCALATSARADEPPTVTPPAPPSASSALFGVPRCTSKQLCWAPSFNRMDVPEMILTGVAAGTALTFNIIHPLNTGWSGGILFDDQVRSALRLGSTDAQLEVRTGTDLGLAVMTSFPILVDSLLVAYWYRGSADVALQMGLIDMEAFAITGAIEGVTNFASGRARPYFSDCGTSSRPANTTDCATDTLHRSFFSGHSAISFTAAALICAHHEALRLFDSGWDHVTCAAGFVAASGIGVLRIVGDAHYFSDVFVGAVVGTTVGLAIPLLHHYRGSSPKKDTSTLRVNFVPGFGSGYLSGTF